MDQAYELCENLYEKSSSESNKSRYVLKLISISEKLDRSSQAIRWSDELIARDKNNVNYRIIRSTHIKDLRERFFFLKELAQDFLNNYKTYNVAIDAGLKCLSELLFSAEEVCQEKKWIYNSIATSLKLDPSLDNRAWRHKVRYYKVEADIDNKGHEYEVEKMNDILQDMEKCNPSHSNTLNLAVEIAPNNDTEKVKLLIEKLYLEEKKSSYGRKIRINELLNDFLFRLIGSDKDEKLDKEFSFFYEKHLDAARKMSGPLLLGRSSYYFGKLRSQEAAKEYFMEALSYRDIVPVLGRAFYLAASLGQDCISHFKSCLEKNKTEIEDFFYFKLKSDLACEDNRYEEALKFCEKSYESGLNKKDYLIGKSFYLLLGGEYSKVVELGRIYKSLCDLPSAEPLFINCQYAAKHLGDSSYDETRVRNLSAQSKAVSVKICAYAILGNLAQATNLLKKEVAKDYANKNMYKSWPILKNLLSEQMDLL